MWKFNEKDKDVYYWWPELFSKDCHINFILGARGIGKTFGLRSQAIREYILKGRKILEIVRFQAEIDKMIGDYHERIEDLWPGYVFKADKKGLYVAQAPVDEDDTPEWEQYGFFAALSEGYQLKRKTFSNKIHRIIFDEFILDKNDKFHGYLKNERDTIATIISTATRERSDGRGGTTPYIYFIANNVDRLCPYFEWFNIDPDKYGFYYTNKAKQILVHNMETEQNIYDGTIASILHGDSDNARAAALNIAVDSEYTQYIAKRPKKMAALSYYIRFEKETFAVWSAADYYFVEKADKINATYKIYAPKLEDTRINTTGTRELRRNMKGLRNLHFCNLLKFDSVNTYGSFMNFMAWLGE